MPQPVRNLFLTLVLLGGLSDVAHADRPRRDRNQDYQYNEEGRHRDRDRGRDRDEGRQRKREMSLDEAVRMVQQRYNARVVRTDVKRAGDRTIYKLRLLNDDGRVWTVSVDASTGSMQ